MKYFLFLFVCLHLTSILEAETDTSLVGKSLLCEAVNYNNYDDTKILLELNKINPDKPCRSDGGATPLHIASQSLSYEAAELLLQYGADANSRFSSGKIWKSDINNQTPLHFAVQNINFDILKRKDIITLLLKRGANPLIEDVSGNKPLDLLNSRWNQPGKKNVKVFNEIKNLLKNPSVINKKTNTGKYKYIYKLNKVEKERLMACIEVDDDLCFKRYLKKLSVNAQTKRHEKSIIHIAASHRAMKILNILLKKGANINALKYDKSTALSTAAFNGDIELAEYLIKHGAKVNEGKTTPLFFLMSKASEYRTGNDIKIAKLLLDSGANPNNQESYFGGSPLDEAVSHNLFDMVQLLLSKGGNPNSKNAFGKTVVFSVKSEKVLKLLLKYRANINIRDSEGKTALSQAMELNQTNLTSLLKKYGARN